MSIEKVGFDLSLTIPSLVERDYIQVITNVNISSGSTVANTILEVGLSSDGEYYISAGSNELGLWEKYYFEEVIPYALRFFMHDNFISFYANERWIHTIYFPNIDYPEYEDLEISLLSSGSMLVQDITLVDLCDWREAIYIDFDTVALNAISSVIQQRPVEIRPTYLGECRFQYSNDEKRDVVDLYKGLVKSVSEKKDANSVISDAIVYGSEVQVITREESAGLHGFITRIIRVPELDTGADRAAKEMMKRAEQQSTVYTIAIRSDLRVEIGDVLEFTATLSGTGRIITISCIVETITVGMKNAIFEMTITGRKYV